MTPTPILRGGIIAAGDGLRLRAGGLTGSKAMALVAGRPLIDHALDRFRAAGIGRLTVIINEDSQDCRAHLDSRRDAFDLDLVVRSTPSSYASFQIVAERLGPAAAVVSTVDSILPEADFVRFVRQAETYAGAAVVLGLTSHVDDEKPLWATLDATDGRVTALGGSLGSHVTAGLYVLPERRPPAPPRPFERLREYLQWLVDEGAPVQGLVLPKVFDVDRPWDIAQAEQALAAPLSV